jgi:hypothetical protein
MAHSDGYSGGRFSLLFAVATAKKKLDQFAAIEMQKSNLHRLRGPHRQSRLPAKVLLFSQHLGNASF